MKAKVKKSCFVLKTIRLRLNNKKLRIIQIYKQKNNFMAIKKDILFLINFSASYGLTK